MRADDIDVAVTDLGKLERSLRKTREGRGPQSLQAAAPVCRPRAEHYIARAAAADCLVCVAGGRLAGNVREYVITNPEF